MQNYLFYLTLYYIFSFQLPAVALTDAPLNRRTVNKYPPPKKKTMTGVYYHMSYPEYRFKSPFFKREAETVTG